MKLDPLQIYEKVLTQDNRLSTYFGTWFRNLSQYLKESQTITSGSNYEYCLIGNTLTINYSGYGNVELNLPYKSASNQVISFWDGNVSKKIEISKNDLKITVPNGDIKLTAMILVRVS